jgi:predicted component of type VI protein secretion system
MESETKSESKRTPEQVPAAEHIAHAHHLLKALRTKLGEHPELSEAITKLEMALSNLTVKTGGML